MDTSRNLYLVVLKARLKAQGPSRYHIPHSTFVLASARSLILREERGRCGDRAAALAPSTSTAFRRALKKRITNLLRLRLRLINL